MSRPVFSKNGSPDMIYPPFIVTDFDLSRQSNVAFHILGDDYKVASFGSRVSVKKINGVVRNPESNLQDAIDFYKDIYIGNNYGEPISFNYLNYSGYGYCTGMTFYLREGSPASISLDFLEIDRKDVVSETKKEDIPDRDDSYNRSSIMDVELYTFTTPSASASQEGEEDYSDTIFGILPSSLQLSMSSRYSITNSRKSIIYYGDNPVQAGMEFVATDQLGNFAAKFNKLLDKLKITRDANVYLTVGTETYPATIVQITSTDQSVNSNYLSYNVSAILGI